MPAISHFKANRLASAYNASTPSSSQSQSIPPGDSILPNPSAQRIRHSIRTGKLDTDGNLVGGEGDSASENETEGLQEMLELFQKGEIYNIGPNSEYIHTIPPVGQGTSASSSRPIAASSHSDSLPPPSMRSKTSKFKASRASAGRPTPAYMPMPEPDLSGSESLSSSTTPVSYETRSSPKLDTPTTPVITPTVSERKPHFQASSSSNATRIQSPRPLTATSNQVPSFPMIIESPSFPAVTPQSTSPILRDSPSFQKQGPSRPDRPPTLSIGIPTAEAQQPSVRTNTNETSSQAPSRPDQPIATVSSSVDQEPNKHGAGTKGEENISFQSPANVIG